MSVNLLGYKIHYTRGEDITSASTLPLFRDGDYFSVLGSTTITRLADMGKGMQVLLEFVNELTIEHDATYLVMPDEEDYTTTAGETIRFVQYLAGGKWKFIGSSTGSGGGSGGVGDFTSPKSSATLGDRVDTNGDFDSDLSGWTAGDGWAWNVADGGCAQHTTSFEATLSTTFTGVKDTHYYGKFTISNRTAGSLGVSIGGFNVYNPLVDSYIFGIDGSYEFGFKPDADGPVSFVITPTTSFDGRITGVEISDVVMAEPAIIIRDDTGADACDILIDEELDNQFMGQVSGYNAYTANHNICYGKNSGESLVSGSYNSFFGKDAGEDCTCGSFNVGMGGDSGASITTGSGNTLLGAHTGELITDGLRNTCIGFYSGSKLTTGESNTLVGPHSGRELTIEVGNTFVGRRAGYSMTGDRCVMIGDSAGKNAGSGDHNIGIGFEALVDYTTGYSNIAIGYRAGWFMTTGYYNHLFGEQAGYNISTGNDNIAIGYKSAFELTTGSENIAIGVNAMTNATTGTENICIGDDAGTGIVTNSYNMCIGASAGLNLTSGDYNVLLGRSARYTGTGTSNVIIGDEASASGSGACIDNVIIGDAAAKDLTTGDNNVILGADSGRHLLTTDDNVIIGHEAGLDDGDSTNNTESFGCVIIGKGAQTYGADDENNIIIGYSSKGIAEVNSTVIGNTSTEEARIYGSLDLPEGQIIFPATQNASSDANTLDDYEEGTFTPAITFGGGSTGVTYGQQTGLYTKVGDCVTCIVRLELTSNGSSTGSAYITGLPFTSKNVSGVYAPCNIQGYKITYSGMLTAVVEPNTTSMRLWNSNANGTLSALQESSVDNAAGFDITVTYKV